MTASVTVLISSWPTSTPDLGQVGHIADRQAAGIERDDLLVKALQRSCCRYS
jgi:hypothetical protein